MNDDTSKITGPIKEYILAEFLPGEDPAALTDSTPLVTSGVLDSIATLKMVAFLDSRFNITIAAHEADVEHMNTVASMVQLVRSKLAEKRVPQP